MSKQAFKRLRKELKIEVNREPLPAYCWPGGYPLYYFCADGGVLCPDCVNAEIDMIAVSRRNFDKQWDVRALQVNWEDVHMVCDHCGKRIESADGGIES